MSVYKRGHSWHYDFWLQGHRHTSPTGFETKADATEAEAIRRRKLTRQAAGLESADAADTPTFTDWAAVTFRWQRDRKGLKRPEAAKNTLRMILAFWGARPKADPVEGGVYKNLRLGDPIANPELIEAFEAWMAGRGLSGARKNHYRSACSMLYRVALLPTHRRTSGVRENPFAGVLRDRVKRRTATLDLEQLNAWTRAAPLPVAIAVTIAALAPGLRFGNVVALRWTDISPARDFLSVPHKADRETGAPLTLSISVPLQQLLAEVARIWPDDPYVVPVPTVRKTRARRTGQAPSKDARYWGMNKLVRASIAAAAMPAGVTFHSLRHAVSTWLARWGVSLAERQRALGHQTPQMAAWYSHLGGADTVKPLALLGERVPIAAPVIARLQNESVCGTPAGLRKRSRGKPRKIAS